MSLAPIHIFWLNWRAHKNRWDIVFGLDSRRYLTTYSEWENSDTADEYKNLARGPTRFTTDYMMIRLDYVRTQHDPQNIFNSWGGKFSLASEKIQG
jgi:hypothetical protein